MMKVLPGLVSSRSHIRHIQKPDCLQINTGQLDGAAYLIVIEEGDTRRLGISAQVAEVLIAHGFSYGS